MPTSPRTAAIVTVGSEIVDGINLDTNTREIATALTDAGYRVVETVSVADDVETLSATFARLTAAHARVVSTGGLGPTHDDITREAAAQALGLPLKESEELRRRLDGIAVRHTDASAREQVYKQAMVIEGAQVIEPTSGTAAGQIIPTRSGQLVLLPGPPHEMRGMLAAAIGTTGATPIRVLGCVEMSESDAQVIAQRVLAHASGVDLTVLATPGNVRVVLVDRGIGAEALDDFAERIADDLGERCYSRTGMTLAQTVIERGICDSVRLALAESCTGGLVSAALTDIPGSSAAFVGGVVAYANEAKTRLLDVAEETLTSYGAVSPQTAGEMARGARERFDADVTVSVTGIAGPDGGTPGKPVGLVWFSVADAAGSIEVRRNFFGDRAGVRERATVTALDLLRRRLEGLEII